MLAQRIKMPDYDFRSLSPIDFEVLVRDLLQEKLELTLESFKPGKDLGIDFRYSTDINNTVIVQCKHYIESGYDALHYVLCNKELRKVTALNPSRYIIATSVPLSPSQKEELTTVLSPYVRNPGDVFGKDDLNNLLGIFPHIERRTVKLWLSSLPILEEVLHSGIYNMSREELLSIRDHASVYVQNESFEEAIRILEDHNFCIIAGIPGIGKTILAEMLALHYSRAGYEVVKVSEDISDAWKLVQPQTRRVFYYDDFLGQTSFSEKLNKNEDQRIIDFVHTVRKSNGVKLILTTREYILQQAYQRYEKLDREGFQAEKCIIDLAKYTRMNRAKILFNHIYFSALPTHYRDHLLQNRAYLKIIDHPNYSPRIVQLLTDHSRLREVSPSHYLTRFIHSMDNPLAIWEHAFVNHLSQSARNLLLVLVTMPFESFVSDVESAYQAFNLAYSKRFTSAMRPQDFRSAMKELDGDFLSYELVDGDMLMKYQNPSVRDFVKQYLAKAKVEMSLLIDAVVFFEQLNSLWVWKEQGGGKIAIRRICQEDSMLGVDLMRRTLSSSPCRLIRVSRAGIIRREHWPFSLAARLSLLAEIGIDCCKPLLKVVEKTIPHLVIEIKNSNFDRDGLAELTEALTSLVEEGIAWATSFKDIAWEALLKNLWWSNDLRPLCRLALKNKDTLPARTKERVEEAIHSVAGSIALGEWDLDADSLREEAESLESLATDIGVDISQNLVKIRKRADELEDESERDDESPEYSSNSSNFNEIAHDEEIASMFSMLDVII
jgi:hypothetical protein